MSELTTTARVKGAARIPAGVTVWDTRIGEIIEEIEGDLREQVALSSFVAATYSEYIDTTFGEDIAFISRWPVLSVVALTNVSTALVDGTDYYWTSAGKLKLIDGVFDSKRQALHVTYTAGLVAVAGTTNANLIRLATLMAVRQFHQEPMAGYEEQSVSPIRRKLAPPTLDRDAIQAEIVRLMTPYVRT